jgi:hypothetical protein
MKRIPRSTRERSFSPRPSFLVLVLVYGIYLHGVVTSMASGQTEFSVLAAHTIVRGSSSTSA